MTDKKPRKKVGQHTLDKIATARTHLLFYAEREGIEINSDVLGDLAGRVITNRGCDAERVAAGLLRDLREGV